MDILGCSCSHPSAKPGVPGALRDIHLQVARGEQLAVIGPSGAGKTTLLQLMACALPPVRGELLLEGTDPWRLDGSSLQRLRRRLFLAPQVPPLPPRQRVVTSVLAGQLPQWSLWASLKSLVYPQALDAADTALAQFDLADKLFERVDRLSGGERQRVGLARLLISNAELLLVDEPLSALDPERGRQALHTLTRAARERNATLVATLHHVEMALAHFPRIVGLREGSLVFDLAADQVTPEVLRNLYASHPEELNGPAPALDPSPGLAIAQPPRVAMQCR